jgi:hypothetical protein
MGVFHVQAVVKVSGPIFDGVADHVIEKVLDETNRELGERGQTLIQTAADAMDRSGRGGTGRAAAGVELQTRPGGYRIWGAMRSGDVWWPWLEGSSSRNRSTRFKGYHTFRDTAKKLDDQAGDVLEKNLAAHMGELGGV